MQHLLSTAALAALITSPILAQTRGAPQTEEAARLDDMSPRRFKRLTVPGETVAANVERLTSRLRWHTRLGAALAEGKAKKKPIVWIQALGDLEGFL